MNISESISVLKGDINPLKFNYIHKLFEVVAQENPKNIAVIFEDLQDIKTVTYEELNLVTNKLAKAIIAIITAKHLPPNNDGDYLIAVNIAPTDKLFLILLAILKCGAAYLPIDFRFSHSTLEHILNEAKPALVIYENNFYFPNQAQISFEELLDQSNKFSSCPLTEKEQIKSVENSLAIVLYTSGSTGVPKGVRLPHKVLFNRLQWQFKKFPYSLTEKITVFKTTLTFGDSICEIWAPLVSGKSVLIIPNKVTQNPEELVKYLDKYKIQRLVLVPSLLKSLLLFLGLQKNDQHLETLKLWICSGESLPISLVKEFFRYFTKNEYILCNFYGSTEVMADVTYYVISHINQLKNLEKAPIGLPIDNTIIYLLDNNLQPVKKGMIGQMWVSGLNLAAGYVNNENSERFIVNPHNLDPLFRTLYRTGDYAKIIDEILIFEGRIDNQVKIRGHKVDLSEVEKAVLSLPIIKKAIVLCYQPGAESQAILAFVTLKNNIFLNNLQIENLLRNELTSYMMPQVVILQNVPLLLNGKVDRQTLLKSYETLYNNENVSIDYSGVSKNDLQLAKIILQTVCAVLNRSARGVISIDSNFYEIGGNSLNSILTIAKLSEQGYNISIKDFIESKSLRDILNNIACEKISVTFENTKYRVEMLGNEHKEDVFNIIINSFYDKADLDQWLKPNIYRKDYQEFLTQIWGDVIAQGLSFIIKNENDISIGVTLNLDADDEPDIKITSTLGVVLEFLEYAEGSLINEKLSKEKGKIIHSWMMGTHPSLNSSENVLLMQFMEKQVLKIGKNRNFVGVFTTNTSPLTQQLSANIFGYQKLADIQVNEYISSDGSKPFQDAPDSQRVFVCWKPL